jgi:hypothetical protein
MEVAVEGQALRIGREAILDPEEDEFMYASAPRLDC